MNTLAEQYQIMRDLEELLGARVVTQATLSPPKTDSESFAAWEGGGPAVMAVPAYPSPSQEPLWETS